MLDTFAGALSVTDVYAVVVVAEESVLSVMKDGVARW